MKKMLTFVIAVISLCGLFTILKSDNAYAATNRLLEKDKVYYYDLDGDGTKEKIYYQTHVSAKDNEFFDSVSLFINDKNVYTKKLTDVWASYKVIDFDTSDKTIELNFQIGSYSYTLDYSSFQRWNGKEITEFETGSNKALMYVRGYRFKNVKGNGRFHIIVDTPYALPIGCFYADIPLQLKGDKIVPATGTYKLVESSKKYVYTAKKNIKVYKKASKKSKNKFTLKKGDKLRIIKIKPAKNVAKRPQGKYGLDKRDNGFAYVKTKNGKTGWIFFSKKMSGWGKKTLFKQVPVWG